MSPRKFYVYMHTNLINNKKYIGITSQEPEHRWAKGAHYSNQVFMRAIKKYGWDNFKHDILFEGLGKDLALAKEKELIAQYRTTEPDYGYNVSLGGEGYLRYATEEERIAARQASRTKTITTRNADPVRRAAYLEQLKELKKKAWQDPVKHEKALAANQRCHLVKRSTPEGRAEDNAATYKIKGEVKQIRNELRDLYEQYPELFTEEDYHFIFDRRQTPNKSWVFVYNSKTTLYNILVRAKEALDGKTDN